MINLHLLFINSIKTFDCPLSEVYPCVISISNLFVVTEMSNNVIQPTEVEFTSQSTCEDRLLLNQAETNFERIVMENVNKGL